MALGNIALRNTASITYLTTFDMELKIVLRGPPSSHVIPKALGLPHRRVEGEKLDRLRVPQSASDHFQVKRCAYDKESAWSGLHEIERGHFRRSLAVVLIATLAPRKASNV